MFGSSGHAKVVGDVASILGWGSIEYFDDNPSSENSSGQLNISGN